MKKKFKSGELIYYLLILFFSLCFIKKITDNDLFFDITTGKNILKYGIDFRDHFSFVKNLLYMYPHWLYDIVIYMLYKIGGYKMLFVFFYVAFTGFNFFNYHFIKKISNNKLFSIFITIVSSYFYSPFFTTRVQSVTNFLILLYIYFLYKFYKEGKIKNLIFLLIISILVLNIHMPLWPLTIILVLPFAFEYFLAYLLKKNIINNKWNLEIEYPNNKKLFNIFMILVCLCGFVSPLKLYPYSYILTAFKDSSLIFIDEMKRTSLIGFKYEIFLILLMFIRPFLKNVKIHAFDLALFVGTFILSLYAVKFVIFFMIIGTIIIAKLYFELVKINMPKVKLFLSRINRNVIYSLFIIIIIFFSASLIISLNFSKFNYNIKENCPVKAVEYMKKNLDVENITLYTGYNYGSFVEFNDIKVFVDSRAEVFDKKFNGTQNVLKDFLDINSNLDDYKKIVEKYNFSHMLVYSSGTLYSFLKNDENFKKIYSDKDYAIFEKVEAK